MSQKSIVGTAIHSQDNTYNITFMLMLPISTRFIKEIWSLKSNIACKNYSILLILLYLQYENI